MSDKKALSSEAAEILRMALPLMSKHDIPPTPRNYAVWYEYVSGTNEQLKERLEGLMRMSGRVSEEQIGQLYRDYLASFEVKLADHARDLLHRLLAGTSDTFSDASSSFARFEDVLGALAERLSQQTSAEDVRSVVSDLSAETRHAQAHGAKLVLRLAESQLEIEELRAELEQTKRRAATDALTGLANRGMFDERLRDLTDRHQSEGTSFGLVMFDIDRFKSINDTHGHLVGDKVIRFVAQTTLSVVKGRDLVARYGGEEFAVLLPRTDLAGSLAVAQGIRAAVERGRLVKSGTREALGVVTVSAGVAVHRKGEPPESLVGRADTALYASKRDGRNRVTEAADTLPLPPYVARAG